MITNAKIPEIYKNQTIQYYHMVYNVPGDYQPAYIRKQHTQNILDRCDEWYMAIERFNVPISSVPMWIYNNNDTEYWFMMSFGTTPIVTSLHHLQFIPWTGNTTNELYYGIYFYDQFVRMMNEALKVAMTEMKGLVGTIPFDLPTPYFQVTNNVLEYVAPELQFSENTSLAAKISVYMGVKIFDKLRGMPTIYTDHGTNPDTTKYRITSYAMPNNTGTTYTSGTYVMNKIRSNSVPDTILRWNTCKGVIVESPSMNIQKEIFPTGNAFSTSPGQNNGLFTKSLMGRFDILYEGNAPRPLEVRYVSQNKYRYVELLGIQPLNILEMNIMWIDAENSVHPLYLLNADTVVIRLIFIRKGVEK
jgi:hypothetical protein